jgi:transcriptional regulator with XRE-family HTH domain
MSMSGTLGGYIRNCREQRGLTQTELAERADVPRTTVNRIETGTTQLPAPDIRRRLARVLGVPHLDLVVSSRTTTREPVAMLREYLR